MLPASEHIFDLSLHLASVYVNPSQYLAQAVTVHSGLGPYTTFLIWCDHADMLIRNSWAFSFFFSFFFFLLPGTCPKVLILQSASA